MSSVVGGWAVPYVGVFLRPVGNEPFSLFLIIYRPPTVSLVLGNTTVPTAALLCTLFTTVRTAALPYCCPAVLLPCYYFINNFEGRQP